MNVNKTSTLCNYSGLNSCLRHVLSQNVRRNQGNFRGIHLPIGSDGDWIYGHGVKEGMNSKQELGWK